MALEAAPVALDHEPAAQGVQKLEELLPALGLKEPAAHAVQAVAPRTALKDPAAQLAQDPAPLVLNVPAAHKRGTEAKEGQ